MWHTLWALPMILPLERLAFQKTLQSAHSDLPWSISSGVPNRRSQAIQCRLVGMKELAASSPMLLSAGWTPRLQGHKVRPNVTRPRTYAQVDGI